MPITVLSELQASRIAAGEVVERPASVVKELVENSLDSGATRISIEIEQGGSSLISVGDNGCGIPPEEVSLAFERFATSKITENSDLASIDSLGFRGEALPSIASVSCVDITTKSREHNEGIKCSIRYGGEPALKPTGVPEGTFVTVTNLFKNVPARLKFLSSQSKESSRIVRIVSNMALVRPDVAFTLGVNGRKSFQTLGNGDRLSAVASVYGRELAKSTLSIGQSSDSAFSVEGLIGLPEITRRTRNSITLSVNNRLISNSRMVFAIKQAYSGYLQDGYYPLAVVNLGCPFSDVDVNVHPAKAEVRFLRDDLVFALLQKAIRTTLTKYAPVVGIRQPVHENREDLKSQNRFWNRPRWNPAWPETLGNESGTQPTPTREDEPIAKGPDRKEVASQSAERVGTTSVDSEPEPTGSAVRSPTHKEVLPILRVIGQAHTLYIIAEGPDGVYLLDQHAAHERVMYETLQKRPDSPENERQPLIDPAVVELPPHFTEFTNERLEVFEECGFVIEPFGGNSVLIREAPLLLVNKEGASLGRTLLEMLDAIHGDWPAESWSSRILATAACHAAVRGGQVLSHQECSQIVRQLECCDQPRTCPHGRPTMLHLSEGLLESNFGRK